MRNREEGRRFAGAGPVPEGSPARERREPSLGHGPCAHAHGYGVWWLRCLSGLLVSAVLAWAAPEVRRVEVTRDLWLSSYRTEREGNNGASPKLKLKGIQEFFLMDFDPLPLRGQRVVRATLHLHPEGNESLGRITVSSVAAAWTEGRGTGYAKVSGASSFAWARTGEARWAGGEPDLTAVINGNGGSAWGFGDATARDAAGWQVVPVAPAVVQARIEGRSEGFCVMDDVGSEYTREGNTVQYRHFPNRYVASREGPRQTAPYFTLWLEAGAAEAAVAPAIAPRSPPAPVRFPPLAATATAQRTPRPVRVYDEFDDAAASGDFFAARNETTGFSVEGAAVRVLAADLPVTRFAMPLVGGHRDPLVPLADGAAPSSVGANARTYVEVHVPKSARAGRHRIALEVDGRTLELTFNVWNFTLPDRLSFIPQMNCYGLPGSERAYYRLAHAHRTVLNRLPYSWTGRVDRTAGPVIRPDGTWDWRAWDAAFGPLFDGTAFADLPRAGVPVDAFYLPLNENWPMNHERHFRGGYWIESAYDDAYWLEFRAAASRVASHFAAQGWTEPMFEFYLNNKVEFKRTRGNRWDATSAAWIFDEPVNTQDFWALRRFGLEFWRGVADAPGVRFAFRADLSRPEWQRDLLDGVTSVEIVSGALRTYRDRVIGRAERFGNFVAMYGSANSIGTPNAMPAAWCVETWALGADGVVPWQTIGKAEAWRTPDPLALFYPTESGPVPSLRLKAFRAGQQLAEYLTMYTVLSGESRAAVGAAVLADPALRPVFEKTSEADAGTARFTAAANPALADLRRRLGGWLDGQAPATRERWHDPRPARHDPAKVKPIAVLPPP